MGEPSTLSARRRPTDGRLPRPGAPSWMSRTDTMGRWLGTLFCGGGVLDLDLPGAAATVRRVDDPRRRGGARRLLRSARMLLAGALNGGTPSAFFLVIAGANVLVSFGAYVSGNPLSGAELFYLWITPYAYALFSPFQAALQTALVAVCWGLVLIRLDEQHPSFGPPSRMVAKWMLTIITVIAVGVLVRVLSRSLRDVDRRFHRAFADSGIGAAFLSTDLTGSRSTTPSAGSSATRARSSSGSRAGRSRTRRSRRESCDGPDRSRPRSSRRSRSIGGLTGPPPG